MLFELENVKKNYGQLTALDDISLEVERGSIGLLGPNGAGKSTLLKICLGLLDADRGAVSVLGYDLPNEAFQLRRHIGYMPETDCYIPRMTAIDYVGLMGQLTGMPRAESLSRAHDVLHYTGLGEARYRQLQDFSTGMKQRVKLAQALVHGPDFVFMDEPTDGLDPEGRDDILELIDDLRARDVGVLVSSHLLRDIEQVCDRVVMLDAGQLLYSGSIDVILGDTREIIALKTHNQNDAFAELLDEAGYQVRTEGQIIEIPTPGSSQKREIFELALENDIQIRHFAPATRSLEQAFLNQLDENNTESTT